jgi:DNA-binding CsgD family transcriptional regulator
MEQGDFAAYVSLLSKNAVLQRRYGALIEHVPAMLKTILDSALTGVFVSDNGSRSEIAFIGISVIVHDDFIKEMKTPPHVWIGPEFVRRFLQGQRPWLTSKEVEKANSNGGLNLLCLDNCALPGLESDSELHRTMMEAFIALHRGYFWKELIANQPESFERAEFLLSTGGQIWNASTGKYESRMGSDEIDFINQPRVIGTARNENGRAHWSGRWVGRLFDYQPPIFGFTHAEKRLLSSATSGLTDGEIASALDVSLSTVKKSWLSIYGRVSAQTPDLFARSEDPSLTNGKRGPEKRRCLLTYLRDHPEELRPLQLVR